MPHLLLVTEVMSKLMPQRERHFSRVVLRRHVERRRRRWRPARRLAYPGDEDSSGYGSLPRLKRTGQSRCLIAEGRLVRARRVAYMIGKVVGNYRRRAWNIGGILRRSRASEKNIVSSRRGS